VIESSSMTYRFFVRGTELMIIRPARQDDLDLLWEFLAMAAYEPSAAAAQSVRVIAHYLEGWQRPTDFGCIAEADGQPVGAAWARHFAASGNPFFLNDRTPELAIGVRESFRGCGIGTALMRALPVRNWPHGVRRTVCRFRFLLGDRIIGKPVLPRTPSICSGRTPTSRSPRNPPRPMRCDAILLIVAFGSEHLSASAVLCEPPMPLRRNSAVTRRR
jgi:GNAT superfamily N-acetyltransferase